MSRKTKFRLASLVIALVAVVSIAPLIDWLSYNGVPLVTADDREIAEQSVEWLREKLAGLDPQDEIVQRYGRFESAAIMELRKIAPHRSALPGIGSSGPRLDVITQCTFEHYPARIWLHVFPAIGKAPEIEVSLTPATKDLKGQIPVVDDGDLWFESENPVHGRVRSNLTAVVHHPGFEPEF